MQLHLNGAGTRKVKGEGKKIRCQLKFYSPSTKARICD